MRRPAFLLGFLLCASAVAGQEARELYESPPGSPDRQCEDENGNTWNLPLEQYQAGMRPQGPCLPVGTWDRMRDRSDPGWRQRREDQFDRDLSAAGPELARAVKCKRCLTRNECSHIASLRCAELEFVSEHCDRCKATGYCTPDRRLGCDNRPPTQLHAKYRQTVVATITRFWSNPKRNVELKAKVRFTISQDGTISQVTISESSRDEAFDRSATDAVTATGHLPRPPPGWPPEFFLEFHSAELGPAG